MRVVREVLADARQRLRGHDLMLASAGASLYGALAGIPSLLVAVGLSRLLLGDDRLRRYGDALASNFPAELGADVWVRAVFDAGLRLSVPGVLFAVLAASAYGDGLRRALGRFAPPGERSDVPGWWTRVRTLPLLGLAPLLLLILLVTTPAVSDLRSGNGFGGALAAVYVGLNVTWVVTWLPLTWAFRVVAPGHPTWRAALIGGVVSGAFVAGFLQGFQLFLALPVNLGRPFGGLVVVGVTTALLLWLWVLHAVVCAGFALTWAVDARLKT